MKTCKFCGAEVLEEYQAFCWDKDCRQKYLENIKKRKAIVSRLKLREKKTLSYLYHCLINPTEIQIKEACRFYGSDFKLIIENIDLRDVCKRISFAESDNIGVDKYDKR